MKLVRYGTQVHINQVQFLSLHITVGLARFNLSNESGSSIIQANEVSGPSGYCTGSADGFLLNLNCAGQFYGRSGSRMRVCKTKSSGLV